MNKRLILVLALALVAGLTMAAYAEVQNVKVSGDLTVLGISRKLDLRSSVADDAGNPSKCRNKQNAMASITRVRVDADLTDNVSTVVRILNERYWGTETNNADAEATNSGMDIDLAYATMKEFLYSPLTLTIGRQELHFGNDMIVGDPDTNNMVTSASAFGGTAVGMIHDPDLSARKAFDAVRATLNYDPLVIDGVAAVVSNPDNDRKDDINLFGINAGYDLNKKTKLEAYWFEKRTGRDAGTTGAYTSKKEDVVDTLGGRVVLAPIENLVYQLEVAYQCGQYARMSATDNTVARKAWALETSLAYDWKKVKYTPSAAVMYAFFSGDDNNPSYDTTQGAYKGWDPMFENQTTGHIANAEFNQTNAHVLGFSASMKPKDDVTVKGEYYMYWWDKAFTDRNLVLAQRENYTGSTKTLRMTDSHFAGQELDGTVTYDYTEDVQFSLLGGLFLPGSSFNKENRNTACEVIGSMKVTF